MNADELEQVERPRLVPKLQVLHIQTKLHRWAVADPGRRFDDLYNFVHDPDVLAEAWRRVRGNRGNRTAGVDGNTAHAIETGRGVEAFLADLRADLKARRFRPLPVREQVIPKTGGRLRRLGIPTVRDRVVQAALKLVLEPIFEADFQPSGYGFRPKRRAQDAIAEIHYLTSRPRNYEVVLEGDIEACLDAWSHCSFADCTVSIWHSLAERPRRPASRAATAPGQSTNAIGVPHTSPRTASTNSSTKSPRSSHRWWPISSSTAASAQ